MILIKNLIADELVQTYAAVVYLVLTIKQRNINTEKKDLKSP